MVANQYEEDRSSGGYLTVLTTRGPMLAKRWASDGSIVSYDSALQFFPSERRVSCLDDLAAALIDLSRCPLSAVVRGKFVGDTVASQVMPSLVDHKVKEGWNGSVQPGGVFRRGELFRDHPCHWVMLDVDGFTPQLDPLSRPAAACSEFVLKCLPTAFHDVSFYWALSGSAGSPKHVGQLKAHLWFWLSEPWTCAQLRAWATRVADVDPSVFNVVQLHYTAAPVFARSVSDPVRIRFGLARRSRPAVADLEAPMDGSMSTASLPRTKILPMCDPGEKPGLVGAFCRAFRPDDLLSLMPEDFEPGRDSRHFSWRGHDSPDGVYVTTCGHGLVSVHATAPSGQRRRRNVFDFVRDHLVWSSRRCR